MNINDTGFGTDLAYGHNEFQGKLSPEKAIEVSGLDWEVEKRPVLYDTTAGIVSAPGQYVIVRKDTDEAFCTVGSRYKEIQNKHAFDYLSNLVDDGDIEIETAVSLKGGKVITVIATKPDHIQIAGEDYGEKLVFTNPHDGSGSAHVFFSGIRYYCRNVQNMMLSGAKNKYSIRHSGNTLEKLQDARIALNMSFKYTEELKEVGEELASIRINGKDFMAFLDKLLPVPNREKHPRLYNNVCRDRANIGSIFKYSENLENIRPTRWGALQSVIQYTNHRDYKSQEKRLEKIITGPALNQRAMELLYR